jgi:predicted unusual protein kinase regulating ubiquinone biosynthesis (AarF/ABC1/UbiB family)
MINSTSKTDSRVRPEIIAGKSPATPASAPRPPETDRLNAASQDSLRAALQQQPEVRPEFVALGQKLAVDANYPPKEIIRQISKMLIASVDASEQP